MTNLSKFFIASLTALILSVSSHAKSVEVVEPKIIGLYFHASWCSACKVLDPEMEAATKSLKKAPFLLVELDVSNKVTQHQAGMIAAATGFDEIYKTTGLKTGFIILIDANTGEEIDRITKADDATAIAAKIKSLAGA